jgi:hypothetical protein
MLISSIPSTKDCSLLILKKSKLIFAEILDIAKDNRQLKRI